jgi:small-conductance mechanosensitive channel
MPADDQLLALLTPWAMAGLWAALALALALLVFRVGHGLALRATQSRPATQVFIRAAGQPAQLVLALLALEFVRDAVPQTLWGMAGVRHFLIIAAIGALTWLAVRLIYASEEAIAIAFPADVADNLRARRVQTRARVMSRTLSGFVIVLGVACVLMTYPGVRQFGTGLLASAGVAGIVIGLAAKPVFGNLLAGLQIAMTQPIRLDDVVIVKDQFARVEEIGGSYVVLRIWDDRRLIVPLQWFIENPFENWTRSDSKLLGAVDLWVDFRMPLEPLRAELKRIVEAAPEWDRRTQHLQVNDADKGGMQLRAVVSAASAGALGDLRNRVREGLIGFIGRRYREYLPTAPRNAADQLGAESGRPRGSEHRQAVAD